MYRKIIVFIMSLFVIMLTACGKNTYPALPDNATAFEMGTFEDAAHDSTQFGTLEYDGRTYIGFGTINNKFKQTDVDQCLGYIVMDRMYFNGFGYDYPCGSYEMCTAEYETQAKDCFHYELEEKDEYDEYCPSSTMGDYSPSCPWNAPGMSVSDFI